MSHNIELNKLAQYFRSKPSTFYENQGKCKRYLFYLFWARRALSPKTRRVALTQGLMIPWEERLHTASGILILKVFHCSAYYSGLRSKS